MATPTGILLASFTKQDLINLIQTAILLSEKIIFESASLYRLLIIGLLAIFFILILFVVYASRTFNQLRTEKELSNNIAEEVRRQIAEDLHSDVQPLLINLRYKIENLPSEVSIAEAAVEIQEMDKTLIGIHHKINDVIFALSPLSLYDLGLAAAISVMVERMSGQFPMTKFEFKPEASNSQVRSLSNPRALFIFRCAQEFILNALKHAGAKQIRLDLHFTDNNTIQLMVLNDGIPYNVKKSQQPANYKGGFGLRQIESRLQFYRGRLNIRSNPENGSVFVLEMPVSENILE